MNGNYQIGDVVFGNWVILREIGKGSFGKVYVVGHEDDQSITAALKVITVPQDEQEVSNAANEGMDYAGLSKHFSDIVQEIENEYKLQFKVKGSGHVVAYEDHKIETHKDQFGRDLLGWDILIRMELLTPLLTWAYEHPMTRGDIIRLGIHMCKALEACQVHGILHRDIKPENIFVSATGDYKLGDFGVARTMEKTVSNMSKKGTYNYMAPEVYKGDDCDFKVDFKADIYSVGIVMYRLLNRNRFPFLPPAPQPVSLRDRDQALVRRMRGERLPLPLYAQDRLGEIVCKAASYDPAQRHTNAAEMRRELEEVLRFERDERTIYPDAEDLKKRQDVDRMFRTVNPSVTPRMNDRTVHLNQFDNTGWGDDTVDDTADRTASGWGARGGFASQERTESEKAYVRTEPAGRQESTEEPEEMTSSTVSAWSHRTPSGRAATEQDRREAAEEEAHIAMQKAKSGAMGEAVGAARKASKEAMKAAKLARENRPARNEKEALEFYEKARKERDAKTAERQTLENMAGMDANLKADMMRDAAKAEMEAVAKENAAKKVWEEFRQKRLDEEEAKRQEEQKRQQEEQKRKAEEARKEAERKRQAEEEARQREEKKRKAEQTKQQKAAQSKAKRSRKKGGVVKWLFVLIPIAIFAIGIWEVSGASINKLTGKHQEMADRAAAIADEYWDMFYDSLDVEGDLDYRTSSIEEIAQVLYDAGFQFHDQDSKRSDDIYIDYSSYGGASIFAPIGTYDDPVYGHVSVYEVGKGRRWVGFEFDGDIASLYTAQSNGEIPAFLPSQYVFGVTTASDFGIDEEMIRWAQKYEGNGFTDGGTWEVRAFGREDSISGRFTLIMQIEEENKYLSMSFEKESEDDGEYVLHAVDVKTPAIPVLAWEYVAEDVFAELTDDLNRSWSTSDIHFGKDSLEDIAQRLYEEGFTFVDAESNGSKEPVIFTTEEGALALSASWGCYDDMDVWVGVNITETEVDGQTIRNIKMSRDGESDVYELMSQSKVPYILPTYYKMGITTTKDMYITDDMLQATTDGALISGDWEIRGSLVTDAPNTWYIWMTKVDGSGAQVDLTFEKMDDQWILARMSQSIALGQDD